MNQAQIVVRDLTKVYQVPVREAGFVASLKSLGKRTYKTVEAVKGVGFSIQAGEIVGFLGPNGAGKTTTLKMLAGLLYPSSGEARVAGFIPWEKRPEYLRRISMVMGNKSQLLWDIPPMDTFYVLGEIYHVPRQELKRTVAEFVDLLDMHELLGKPVRNFSLGERMKCELVAALLHCPEVLFLDEPTLGLDVSMQGRLRGFIAEYNRRTGATVILTSHYMADVMALCPRVIFIHQGAPLYDGELTALAQQLAPFKLIRVVFSQSPKEGCLADLPKDATVLEQNEKGLTLRVERAEAPALTAHLLNTLPVADLVVEDPPIEAVIDQIYQGGSL
jgi:ABC-2 type transport system ATP-binding protein